MIRLAVSNQKGGVGKTTLTRELGLFLAAKNRQVLLVDCDPVLSQKSSHDESHVVR